MRARPAASAATVVTAMLVALFMAAVPTRAQDAGDDLGELTIAVVSSNGGAAPRPTGRVFVSADGGGLTLRLARGTERMTSVARTTSDSLAALGTSVTITYSGDSNYETSASVTVTLPIVELPSIVARPRDTTPPAIEIVSPGDGVRYARGEAVVASYFCDDPNDRSEVTECEGPIDEGSAVDTNTEGTFSFTVRAEDAFGNEAFQDGDVRGRGPGQRPRGLPARHRRRGPWRLGPGADRGRPGDRCRTASTRAPNAPHTNAPTRRERRRPRAEPTGGAGLGHAEDRRRAARAGGARTRAAGGLAPALQSFTEAPGRAGDARLEQPGRRSPGPRGL